MTQPVWPGFVRLSHWLLAVIVIINWFNATGEWHRLLGYGAAALILSRLLYGSFSRQPAARFYWPRLAQMLAHVQALLPDQAESNNQAESHSPAESHVGHNPLGQLAVYAMWLLVLLLAFTGWLSRIDAYWGEDWPVSLHGSLSSLLQGLVVVHVTAVLLMSRWQRQNLIRRMILRK